MVLQDRHDSDRRTATLVVAASDSTAWSKRCADYVCDGTADDEEIQAALELLNTAGGGVLRLVGKTFSASTYIGSIAGTSKYNNVTIQGDGVDATVIEMVGDDNVIDIRGGAGARIQSLSIRDLTVKGNQASATASIAGIRLDYVDFLVLDNVKIIDVGNPTTDTQGIAIGINYCRYGFTDRLTVMDYTHYGFSYQGCSYFTRGKEQSIHSSTYPTPANAGNHGFFFSACSYFSGGDALIYNPCDNTDFAGFEIVGASSYNHLGDIVAIGHANHTYGVHLYGVAPNMISNTFGSITVKNFSYGLHLANEPIKTAIDSLSCYTPTLDGITWGSGGSNGLVIGKFVCYQAGRNGIRWNTHKLRISQIDIEGCQNEGIYLDEYADYCEFLGGVIKNNGQATANTYSGIYCANASTTYVIIDNILFEDDQGVPTQRYGIESIGDYITIGAGNQYKGNVSGAVSHTGIHDKVKGGIGYIIENSGTATILNGNNAVVVDHGLVTNATSVLLTGTHTEVKDCIVTGITATQFTITAAANVTADRDVYWRAVIGAGN